MRPPSAAQSRAVAVAPAPRGFPVVAYPESIARGTRCLLLTHISITVTYTQTALNHWNTDRGDQYQLDAVSARLLQDHEVTDRDRILIALRELDKNGCDAEPRP